VSIEDRVRAATRARTDLVRGVRPLEFPAEATAPVRRDRSRRWLNWGAPIAAAALVTALALTLALLRQAGGPPPGQVTPAASQTALTSIPRYYVTLAYTGSTSAQMEAVVGDDQTGKKLAVIRPSASQNFYGVTAAADDRTFVLMSYAPVQQVTTWYLLRLTPGAAHPTQLTELPIKSLAAHVNGLALSPDGRELAVMWLSATTATNGVTHLSIYSMSSGAPLGTWTTHAPNDNVIGGNANSEDLTWLDDDRRVDFRWADRVPATVTVKRPNGTIARVHTTIDKITIRALDVTAAGHDLLADSQLVMPMPASTAPASTLSEQPCTTSQVASSETLICGSSGFSDKSGEEVCSEVPPLFASYSTATGKQLKVLYRYQGECLNGLAEVLWTDPTGSHVVAFIGLALKGKVASTPAGNLFGVVADGHFTPLPALVTGTGWASDAANGEGGMAF
jgi:hypothetical protein